MVESRNAEKRRRAAAGLAAAGCLFFLGTATAVQLLRPAIDPLRVPLSRYLAGPWGLLLHCAYYVLAAAILFFAYALRAALPGARRSAWTTSLLAATAAGVAVAAAAWPLRLPAGADPSGAAEGVHLLASGLAFLAASVVLTLTAVRIRPIAPQRFAAGLLALAGAENLALLAYVFVPTGYGATLQKLVILLIVAALLAGAALCGRRDPLPGTRTK